MAKIDIDKLTDEEKKKLGAALLGSVKSERKAQASRENGFQTGHTKGFQPGHKLAPGKEPIPFSSSRCTCTGGESTTRSDHKSTCPKYHLITKRNKLMLDVLTGKPISTPSVSAE